ncbi:DMT family transporter [Musicola keenii]|uniref:DMT family transporter n=1 Tax=Musicola keenii TaxID=2884250 RepID=UPI00178288F6|nr:DMT family transporter [Musicola keenii]
MRMNIGSGGLAIGAGALLSAMIGLNSQLAVYSSPAAASWVAHGIGTIAAGVLLRGLCFFGQQSAVSSGQPAPWWAWLGGIPGAMTVLLAAITVNSPLALSGSLALMLLGQMLFGMATDVCGGFGMDKRRLTPRDGGALLCVLAGTLLLIMAGR